MEDLQMQGCSLKCNECILLAEMLYLYAVMYCQLKAQIVNAAFQWRVYTDFTLGSSVQIL